MHRAAQIAHPRLLFLRRGEVGWVRTVVSGPGQGENPLDETAPTDRATWDHAGPLEQTTESLSSRRTISIAPAWGRRCTPGGTPA